MIQTTCTIVSHKKSVETHLPLFLQSPFYCVAWVRVIYGRFFKHKGVSGSNVSHYLAPQVFLCVEVHKLRRFCEVFYFLATCWKVRGAWH